MEQQQALKVAGMVVGGVILLKVITAVTVSYQLHQMNNQIQAQQEAANKQAEAYKAAQLTAIASQPTPAPRSLSYHQKSMKAQRTRKTKSKVAHNGNPLSCCEGLSYNNNIQCKRMIIEMVGSKSRLYVGPGSPYRNQQEIDDYIDAGVSRICDSMKSTDDDMKRAGNRGY